MAGIQKRRSVGDFVGPAYFPEPNNPLYNYKTVQPNWDQNPVVTMGDFVFPASFPEPHNPIYPDTHTGIRGIGKMGCGGGCGCSDCGMGAIAVPTWAATLPAPLNGVDPVLSVPYVYWGLGAVALLVVVPMISGRKGRR